MYSCKNKCICAECKRIKKNCAECKYSVKKTFECLKEGIKECKYFQGDDNENGIRRS